LRPPFPDRGLVQENGRPCWTPDRGLRHTPALRGAFMRKNAVAAVLASLLFALGAFAQVPEALFGGMR